MTAGRVYRLMEQFGRFGAERSARRWRLRAKKCSASTAVVAPGRRHTSRCCGSTAVVMQGRGTCSGVGVVALSGAIVYRQLGGRAGVYRDPVV